MSEIGDGLNLIDPRTESAVLAAYITRPESRRNLAAIIGSQHFAHTPHQAIWPLVLELGAAGRTLDPGILRHEVGIRKIGVTPADLAGIFVHQVSDAAGAVDRIIKLHRHRWTLAQADRLHAAALNLNCDIIHELSQVAAELQQAVRRAVRRQDGAEGVRQLRERLDGMIAGKIRNIGWPDGPMMSAIARALESGSIAMVGGMPGDGKTFLILQSLIGWIEQGITVAVCMLEKRRAWHLNRCVALLQSDHRFLQTEWVERNADEVNAAFTRHEPILNQISASLYESDDVGSTLAEIGRWIDAQMDDAEVVIVDPISLADAGDRRWLADADFIKSCIRSCERTNGRIILVTHPNSTKGVVGLQTMSGGQVYQRATDTVLFITKHEKPKKYEVKRAILGHSGTARVNANRTISVHKGRNATQGASKFAFTYEKLHYVEQGLILKESKADDDEAPDIAAEIATATGQIPDNIFEDRSRA